MTHGENLQTRIPQALQQWQITLIKERILQARSKKAVFISHSEVMRQQEKKLKAKLGL